MSRMSRRTRWWHLVNDEDGLGLAEVVVALFVLSVALLALASVMTTSLMSLRTTRDREQAINAASAAIEEARSKDFSGLALASGSADLTAIPAGALPAGSSGDCFGDEPIVTDAVVDPVVFERVAGNNQQILIHTVVTYAEAACPNDRTDLKRVTSIASWTDGGNTRHVTQDTLVASAARGLPVPKFEVRPRESTLGISKAFLVDETGTPKCVEHQLRNLGAEDTYDFEVEAVEPTATVLELVDGYLIGGGDGWEVTAYLDYPAVASRGGDQPPTTSPPKMSKAGGAPRPASYPDERVEPGDIATFTVCYKPLSNSVDESLGPWPQPEDMEVTLVVRSRFDERQERRVTHQVSVVEHDPGTPLYLFARVNNSSAQERQETRPNGTKIWVPFVMGQLSDDPNQDPQLGTIAYTVPNANWSTDVGSNNFPGARFTVSSGFDPDPEVDVSTMAWHHQFSAATTLRPEARLEVWHAPVNALSGSGLPVGGQPVKLRVHVDVLRNNEKTVDWVGISEEFDYVHTTQDWEALEIDLDLGPEQTFSSGRYLRVRITCAESNSVDCNLAYHNVAHPSALRVQVK